jgi:hypothetical protein
MSKFMQMAFMAKCAVHMKGMSRQPVSALCENIPHLSRYTFVPSNKYVATAQKVCATITRAFSCAGWQKSLLYKVKNLYRRKILLQAKASELVATR